MTETMHQISISNAERDFLRYDMHIDLLTKLSIGRLILLHIILLLIPLVMTKVFPKRIKLQRIHINQPLYTADAVKQFSFFINNLNSMYDSYILSYNLVLNSTNISNINFTAIFHSENSFNKKNELTKRMNWKANQSSLLLHSGYFQNTKSMSCNLYFPDNIEIRTIYCWIEFTTSAVQMFHILIRISFQLILYFLYKYLRNEMKKKGYKCKEQLSTRFYLQIMLFLLFPIDITRKFLNPILIRITKGIFNTISEFISSIVMMMFLCEQVNYNSQIKNIMVWINSISTFSFTIFSICESIYNSSIASFDEQTNFSIYLFIIVTFASFILIFFAFNYVDPDHEYYVSVYSSILIISNISIILNYFLKQIELHSSFYDLSEPFYLTNFLVIAILLTIIHSPIDNSFVIDGGLQEFKNQKKLRTLYQKQENLSQEIQNSTSLFSDSD